MARDRQTQDLPSRKREVSQLSSPPDSFQQDGQSSAGSKPLPGHRESQHTRIRCRWAEREPELSYHDTEWGVPVHDDRTLFEFLILEGAQAGLSWRTILNKREGYRRAFDGFDPAIAATFSSAKIDALVADPTIVRHRGKIEAAVTNARAFLAVQREHGSFDRFLWDHAGGVPVVTRRPREDSLPATTALSDQVSRALLARGFKFVGSTIIYAYLQATGVVDDHCLGCCCAV